MADPRNGRPKSSVLGAQLGVVHTALKTQNAIKPRRRLPVSRPISEKNVKVRNH